MRDQLWNRVRNGGERERTMRDFFGIDILEVTMCLLFYVLKFLDGLALILYLLYNFVVFTSFSMFMEEAHIFVSRL